MPENLALDLSNAPAGALRSGDPEPGDVFRKAGGPPGFWLVVAVTSGGSCHVLSFDHTGEINGSQSYRAGYFRDNMQRRVGRAELPLLTISWELK